MTTRRPVALDGFALSKVFEVVTTIYAILVALVIGIAALAAFMLFLPVGLLFSLISPAKASDGRAGWAPVTA